MDDLKSDLSIFWHESGTYIGVYAAFAIIACLIVSGLEVHQQSSQLPWIKLLPKAVALAIGTSTLFALCLFIVGWRSRWLGGEIPSTLIMGVIWYALLYWLNSYWSAALGVVFAKPALYAHVPIAVLVLPYVALSAFVLALGAAFHI